jgi:hypothetical protein
VRREKEDCSFIVSRSERKGAADAKRNTLYPLLRYALREKMSQVLKGHWLILAVLP